MITLISVNDINNNKKFNSHRKVSSINQNDFDYKYLKKDIFNIEKIEEK